MQNCPFVLKSLDILSIVAIVKQHVQKEAPVSAPSDNQKRQPSEPGTYAEANPWHSLESTPAAVATLVEEDLQDEEWLRKSTAS